MKMAEAAIKRRPLGWRLARALAFAFVPVCVLSNGFGLLPFMSKEPYSRFSA